MTHNTLNVKDFPLMHRAFVDFLRFAVRLFKGGKNITKFYKVFSTKNKDYFLRMKANVKDHNIAISITDGVKANYATFSTHIVNSKDIEPFLFARKTRISKKVGVNSFSWRTGFHGVIDNLFENFHVQVSGVIKGALQDILLQGKQFDYKIVEISVWLKNMIEEGDGN